MNAQVAMRVGQLLCGTSLRRAALLPPHSQPMVPEFARPFRSTTVQMGRRAAKIAGRKVRISLGCTGCVAARLAPTLKAPHPSGLHSSRGLALTLCCPAYADVFLGQSRCQEGQNLRQDWQEDHSAVSCAHFCPIADPTHAGSALG
jgi:hypothetical protein